MFGRTDATLDIKAIIKRGPSPQVGVLDVHFHFTEVERWTAESAPNDPDFQAAVERMASFYRPIGIELGHFTYQDIDPMYRSVDAGPMVQVPLKAQSKTCLPSINTIRASRCSLWSESVQDNSVVSSEAFRVAHRVQPPWAAQHGVEVAVATAMTPDADSIGHIMGHESGHFLSACFTLRKSSALRTRSTIRWAA